MFQQLPPPSSSCPKAYPNLGALPHHAAALTNELLCKPKPLQTLPGTQVGNMLGTTTDAHCSQPATRLLHSLRHAPHGTPAPWLWMGKGWHFAGSASAGRQKVRRKLSNSSGFCFAKLDCAEFHVAVERTRGHTKRHGSLAPRTANANHTVTSHLV